MSNPALERGQRPVNQHLLNEQKFFIFNVLFDSDMGATLEYLEFRGKEKGMSKELVKSLLDCLEREGSITFVDVPVARSTHRNSITLRRFRLA